MEMFAAAFAALYVAHHVGDYWIQTDHQAQHKGKSGVVGRLNCAAHVLTYVLTQAWCLALMWLTVGYQNETDRFWVGVFLALGVSGVMHYLADRREHGLMFWLIRKMEPGWGKATFGKLGAPRAGLEVEMWEPCPTCQGRGVSYDESTGGKCWDCQGGGMLPGHIVLTDNPSLGTGVWALDQSWHLATSVFVPALIIAAMA